MDNNGNLFDQVTANTYTPARNHAIASLVLGIVSVAMAAINFFSELAITGGLILAIVGVVLASVAKKKGNNTGIRTAGQVLSIIGIIANSLVLVACAGIVGCASCMVCSAFGAAAM